MSTPVLIALAKSLPPLCEDFLGLRTQLGHHKWRLYPKRRLYDRICASCATCSLHAVHVYVSRQENQCWEAGFQRIASQIARSLFACPSQELIARENFLDWLQSGVEASTALSEWTGGAGVLPSLNACRCLRWKPWRLGAANFTDGCRRRRPQSMSSIVALYGWQSAGQTFLF